MKSGWQVKQGLGLMLMLGMGLACADPVSLHGVAHRAR